MKKILHISGSLAAGGLEKVASQYAKYLQSDEVKVDYLVFNGKSSNIGFEDLVQRYGSRIFTISDPKANFMKFFMDFIKVLKQNGPYDIVHSHLFMASSYILFISKLNHVPLCIAQSHSIKRSEQSNVKNYMYPILRKILNYSADVFCASSYEAGIYLFGEKCFKNKGVVLQNPIDLDMYRYCKEQREQMRKKLHIDASQKVIGTIGRLVKSKNISFLLDYVNQCNLDVRILIIGDGVERSSLTKKIAEYQMEDRVIMLGNRSDIAELLSTMDVFVFPSRHEGFGMVLIEAMANGLDCIVNQDAIIDSICKLPNCHPLDGYDPVQWAKKTKQLLSTSRSTCYKEQIFALKEFSIERWLSIVKKMYRIQ